MSNRRGSTRNRLSFEPLEARDLLAINWVNLASAEIAFKNSANFGEVDGALAVETVKRAIADWNSVITSFNNAVDSDSNPNNNRNNAFDLTITAEALTGDVSTARGVTYADAAGADGKPFSPPMKLDNDAGGAGCGFASTLTLLLIVARRTNPRYR